MSSHKRSQTGIIPMGIFFAIIATSLLVFPALAHSMDTGTAWVQATESAGFTPRAYGGTVTFDQKIWTVGGLDTSNQYHNDVWYSKDGITWSQATDSAGFSPRYGHSMVVFDGKMWVIGGYDKAKGFLNDVWYSDDGITWLEATGSGAFTPRLDHTSVVFQNKMWITGGEVTEHPWIYTNDTWYSSDGVTWTEATSSAGFAPRIGHAMEVFDDAMWIYAGVGDAYGAIRFHDVWYSRDGISWKEVTDSAAFSPRYSVSSLVYDNKMWMIGGFDGTYENDIWYSDDGITWNQVIGSASFSPRNGFVPVVFNDQMWIIGGWGKTNQCYNDVWHSS